MGILEFILLPTLGQWISFFGGLFIVSANSVWIGMMFYYMNQEYIEREKNKNNI